MAFQGFLKQSIATTLKLGPFVDKTDGVTYEVGMAAAMNDGTTGVRISKNGGAFGARNTATEPVYDAFGYYLVNLDATDVATVGRLKVIFGDAAVCLPCEADFEILEEAIFDALYAASAAAFDASQRVDVGKVAGTAQTANDIGADVNDILVDTAVIGALGAGLTAITDKTSLIPADPADQSAVEAAITAAHAATDALVTAVDDFVDTEVGAIKGVTDKLDSALELDGAVYRFTTNALEQAPTGGSAPTALAIADAVWDELKTGHTTADSFGKIIQIMLQIWTGKWAITNNQLIMYDSDGTTPLYTFNLKQDGAATEFNPDERTPV